MDDQGTARPPRPARRAADRKMVRSQLLGGHSHAAANGACVHVYRRDGKYMARGRHGGRQFGQTLGADEREAAANLRRLLGDLDDGAFVMPSESRKRPLATGPVPRLTLRQLIDAYLAEKRKLKGGRRRTPTARGSPTCSRPPRRQPT